MGNVNSFQAPQSYSFFDSNKPYQVSGMFLTSLSVAAFVGGIVWGNYSHVGCWALIGSGALGTVFGLILIIKNCYVRKEGSQASTPKKNHEAEKIETSKSSRKIQLPLEECIKQGHYILARDALQRGERPNKMNFHYGPQILGDLIGKDPSSTILKNFCGDTGRIYDQTPKAEIIFHFYNEMFQLLRSFGSLSYNTSMGERLDLIPYHVALERGSFSTAYALILNHIETKFFDWQKAFNALTQLPNDPIAGSQAVEFFRLSLQKFKCLPGHIDPITLQSLYNQTSPSQHQNVRDIYHLACIAVLRNERPCKNSLSEMSRRGLDVNHPSMVDFFVEMVIQNNTWIVLEIIKKGINLNQPDSQGRLPLHEAACANHLPLAEYLLDHGADKQKLDKQDKTAFEVASNENMRIMIVNWKEADTRLHQAIEARNLQLLQSALNDGADINCKRNEQTVLEKALRVNQFTTIKFLIEKGASIKEFQNPISLLKVLQWHPLNDDDLRQFCTETGQEFSIENRRALIFNYYDRVFYFFFDKKEFEKLDERGSTPLLQQIHLNVNLAPFTVEHYLLCSGDVSNPATAPTLAAAAFWYLAHSKPEDIDYNDALNIWNSLINNIDVFAKVPWRNDKIFTLFKFTAALKHDHKELEKLHFEMSKKGIAQLINAETPQNEEQRKLQREYFFDVIDVFYSFYQPEDEPFILEMFAQAVDKGHCHLISPLSEFVDINLPWEGLTPLQRAKSEEMRKLLIELGAKEGS